MRPRQKIHSVREFERWLRAQGFSKREALQLAATWRKLHPAGEGNGRVAAPPTQANQVRSRAVNLA